VPGSRFLDVFAGTGAVGIEAISASHSAVFVEIIPQPSANRENLAALEIKSEARIIATARRPALEKSQRPSRGLHFLFLDPPYANKNDYQLTLDFLPLLP